VQPQLNPPINLPNHPHNIPQSPLLNILKPRFLIHALPERSVNRKIDLDREFLSRNSVLQPTHSAEQSGLVHFKSSFAVLVVERDNHACACWEADLESHVFGDGTLVFQALESRVALDGCFIIASLDGKPLEIYYILFDFGWWDVFSFSRLVHRERSHTLRQRAEDRELKSGKVRSIAGFAVWNSLQATGQAFDALAEDGFGVGEEDAAYEVTALRQRRHSPRYISFSICW
jgi:hypothetical protein